ncbi:MAG: hypothetical protein K8T10_04290 [Candidatus Eremiobacteraeota bacterium]|nr:hypothetical protein [Candidatus Eremiobacteraeota bacterium]
MITSTEAKRLIEMEKVYSGQPGIIYFPTHGQFLNLEFSGRQKKENFLVDISRKYFRVTGCTFQERYRVTIPLIRLDIDGRTHKNPDNTYLQCPHIHIYKEGYMDKWAYPLDTNVFPDLNDIYKTMEDFFRYCNITDYPIVQEGLPL